LSVWESVPWLLPGLLVSIGVSMGASGRVASALAVSRRTAAAGIASVGMIVSATLSPLREAIESGTTSSGSCDLSSLGLASLAELMAVSLNDRFLNVVLFVPLGLVIGLAQRSRRRAALYLAGGALPFAIETTQLLVPSLARACEGADVIDNLTGLALGLFTGALISRVQ